MTQNRTGIVLVGVVVALLMTSGVAVAVPSVSAEGGDVTPGETVTVDISVEDTGLLSLAAIPSDWTIESYDKNGAEVVEGTTDSGDQKIGWTWSEDQSVDISVTLGVPEDEGAGAFLEFEASDIGEETTSTGLMMGIEDEGESEDTSEGEGRIGGEDDIETTTDDGDESTTSDEATEDETSDGETNDGETDADGAESTSTSEQSDTATPTSEGGPGFTVVGALVALVALAGLARRE
ncbi:MAG: PGF-CTERM sorting domain-containing protein [Halococcoides sp.]